MRYILFLRAVNVGGKNKVSMTDLKALLYNAGFENLASYINSGNLFFSSAESREACILKIRKVLETNYDFSIPLLYLPKKSIWKNKRNYRIGGKRSWQEEMFCSFPVV